MADTLKGDRVRNTIRKLLEEGNNRTKIAEIVGIAQRNVDRHIQKIHEQDRKQWKEITTESLEGRALLIKEKYEKIADKAEAIIDQEDVSAKDLDIAAKLLMGCHNNIYNMIKDGPLNFKVVKVKELEDKEYDSGTD